MHMYPKCAILLTPLHVFLKHAFASKRCDLNGKTQTYFLNMQSYPKGAICLLMYAHVFMKPDFEDWRQNSMHMPSKNTFYTKMLRLDHNMAWNSQGGHFCIPWHYHALDVWIHAKIASFYGWFADTFFTKNIHFRGKKITFLLGEGAFWRIYPCSKHQESHF